MSATSAVAASLATSRGSRARAGFAFFALCLFVVLVYSNPGLLFFPDREDAGIAKVAAGLSLFALGLSWLLGDRRLRIGGAAGVLLGAYYLIVGVSFAWSLWPKMTMDTFLDGTKYLAVFLLAANLVDTVRRGEILVHFIALSSAVPAIGEINSWAHGEHLVEGDRASWIGIFGNPNDLAYYLVVGVALSMAGRELARARWLKIAYLPAIGVMGTGILLTQSRGGLISAGVVLGLWALKNLRSARAVIGAGALVVLAIWAGPAATWHRAQTTLDYKEDASAQGRIDAWRTGLNVMKGRPLQGVGAGAFPLAWAEYAPGDAGEARTAHNTFVQVAAETGLPSFAVLMGAIACGLFGLNRAARARRLRRDGESLLSRRGAERLSVMARATQTGICGFLACSLTGGLAYSWPIHLLLGLAVALARIEREGSIAGLGETRGEGDREEPARTNVPPISTWPALG